MIQMKQEVGSVFIKLKSEILDLSFENVLDSLLLSDLSVNASDPNS